MEFMLPSTSPSTITIFPSNSPSILSSDLYSAYRSYRYPYPPAIASMPTLASQSTAASVRRARRRERRIRNRARPPVLFPHKPPTTSDQRRLKRRQGRDRASFDVDDCFNICQDRGYHRNPDVRLGTGVRTDGEQTRSHSMIVLTKTNYQSINLPFSSRMLPVPQVLSLSLPTSSPSATRAHAPR